MIVVIGVIGILTIVLAVMKSLGVIAWSWLVVFAPMLVEIMVFGILIIVHWWSE